jgi:hypothetical protein
MIQASSPGATASIRPPSDVLAQSVCRTSSLPMEVSTVFGADLNCSETGFRGSHDINALLRRALWRAHWTCSLLDHCDCLHPQHCIVPFHGDAELGKTLRPHFKLP